MVYSGKLGVSSFSLLHILNDGFNYVTEMFKTQTIEYS